jgi:hypothetical protein
LEWDGVRSHVGEPDPDDIAFVGNFGGLWPVHPSTGIPWTQPQGGWALFARNESGATDTLDLYYNAFNFTADLMTDDPVITTDALDNAVYDVFYSFTLERANGTSPFTWSLLIGPGWMTLGEDNGTLYGTPDGTGTEQVRVKLSDAVPRFNERQWTLTIGSGSEGGEGDEEGGFSGICAPGWMMFAIVVLFLVVFIGWTADTVL